jgi:hypothetical protein
MAPGHGLLSPASALALGYWSSTYLRALTLKYGPVVVPLFVAISYTFASCTANLNKEINLIIFYSICSILIPLKIF